MIAPFATAPAGVPIAAQPRCPLEGRLADVPHQGRRIRLDQYRRGVARASQVTDINGEAVFEHNDQTEELSAAWGVKEQLRRTLSTSTVEQAGTEKMVLACHVLAPDAASPLPRYRPGAHGGPWR
jgi:hypothetical protein